MLPQGNRPDPDTIILRRLTPLLPSSWPPEHFDSGPHTLAAVLDTETTGIGPGDRVVEVAWRLLMMSDAGEVVWIGPVHAYLDDPGIPITKDAYMAHGITQEMVTGAALPVDQFLADMARCHWIIAHNASFDRSMMLRRCPELAQPTFPAWACSWSNIDWRARGHRHGSLESLVLDYGCFYEAHRAAADVEALSALLAAQPIGDTEHPTNLHAALVAATQPIVHVSISGRTYDCKDEIKSHGFRWHEATKSWVKRVPRAEINTALEPAADLAKRYGLWLTQTPVPTRALFDDAWVP